MGDTSTTGVNVPGRVIEFYENGQAYSDFNLGRDANVDADELALFAAVNAGTKIRPSKGGFYVKARLTPAAIKAARYWAETMATAVGDDARWGDPDARNDLRAANRLLGTLSKLPTNDRGAT